MAPEKVLPSGGGRPWGTCQPHISPTTHPIGIRPGTYTPLGNRNRKYILNFEERAWLWLHPREVHHCSACFSTTIHPHPPIFGSQIVLDIPYNMYILTLW